MNRASACLIVAATLLAGSTAEADVYIKETNRTESYVLGFRTATDNDPASELWIGETALAYLTPGRTFIVDLEARTFTVVNAESRTYVQSSLPVDLSAILSSDMQARYKVWHRSGTVGDTGKTEEILGKTATEYKVESWEVEGGEKSNKQSIQVWATTDVDFDWKRIDELLDPLRIILNRDETLRKELHEIEGVQLKVEWWTGWFGKGRKHLTEVVEIALDRDPPKGVYTPPADYERKERLTRKDL
jgi:hypothetical protein